jgi:hypothetical protein
LHISIFEKCFSSNTLYQVLIHQHEGDLPMKRFLFLSVLALSMSAVLFGTAQAGPKGSNKSTNVNNTTAVGGAGGSSVFGPGGAGGSAVAVGGSIKSGGLINGSTNVNSTTAIGGAGGSSVFGPGGAGGSAVAVGGNISSQ